MSSISRKILIVDDEPDILNVIADSMILSCLAGEEVEVDDVVEAAG